MLLRSMTMTDIAAGLRLNQNAGWNQTAADWERFLRASPEGCFVAEVDGHVCGTVATISYENRFAWIGMVLVDPERRGHGIGTKLLEAAIQHLDDRKISTIKLDATPQGKPLYEKLGFETEYAIERWSLRRSMTETLAASGGGLPKEMSASAMEAIFEADREAFGGDRRHLLKSLHADAPEFTMATDCAGTLAGYTFGRHGLFADHLGPWMAKDPLSARSPLAEFLARSSRDTLVVDCLKANNVAAGLLASCGFTYARLLTRMYRGPNTHPGRPDMLCAIMGPEFG